MRKRLTSILICLAMMLTMVSVTGPAAFADITSPEKNRTYSPGDSVEIRVVTAMYTECNENKNYCEITVYDATRGGLPVFTYTGEYTAQGQEIVTAYTPTEEGNYSILVNYYYLVNGFKNYPSGRSQIIFTQSKTTVWKHESTGFKVVALKSISDQAAKLAYTSTAYTGKAKKPAVTIDGLTENTDYTVSYTNNTKVGTATVTIEGKGDYTGTITKTFRIVPKKTAIKTPSVASDGITVNWSKNTSCSGYYIYRSVNGGKYAKVKTITGNSTVSWKDTDAATNGSKYSYKIIAYKTISGTTYKSEYSEVKTIYFVSRPSIYGLTNSAAKKMTVKWGKNSKATGYQIQYSLKSDFSDVKSTTVTGSGTVSKVIGSLTKGKTYYVRIRTYKTVDSTKYYSAWSARKSVKIAK